MSDLIRKVWKSHSRLVVQGDLTKGEPEVEICWLVKRDTESEEQAIGKLIAAVPDMFMALNGILTCALFSSQPLTGSWASAVAEVRRVVDLAEAKSP